MGKKNKKKKIINEVTSKTVSSKAAKLLSKSFHDNLAGFIKDIGKLENKRDKTRNDFNKAQEKLDDVYSKFISQDEEFTGLLNDLEDFVDEHMTLISSVAASALTQASGGGKEDGEEPAGADEGRQD